MVLIATIRERHKEARVGDRFHFLENPFRDERPGAPDRTPARRMKGWSLEAFAFSNCSRTILPLGTPVVRAVVSSHSARSAGNRTVIVVLPICLNCNTFAGDLFHRGRNEAQRLKHGTAVAVVIGFEHHRVKSGAPG
jgi:hypothetical protein